MYVTTPANCLVETTGEFSLRLIRMMEKELKVFDGLGYVLDLGVVSREVVYGFRSTSHSTFLWVGFLASSFEISEGQHPEEGGNDHEGLKFLHLLDVSLADESGE